MNSPLITLQWWYARCRSCKWHSKEYPNKGAALEAYLKHAKKHCAIESAERKVDQMEQEPKQ